MSHGVSVPETRASASSCELCGAHETREAPPLDAGTVDGAIEELFQPLPAPGSERFARLVRFCEANESEVLAALPHVLAELADAVGFETLFVFLRAHSGNTIAFGADHVTFGRRYGLPVTAEKFETLQDLCGGNPNADIPSGCGVLNALRRVAVRQYLRRTADPRAAARRFGVTRRYLRKLAAS